MSCQEKLIGTMRLGLTVFRTIAAIAKMLLMPNGVTVIQRRYVQGHDAITENMAVGHHNKHRQSSGGHITQYIGRLRKVT